MASTVIPGLPQAEPGIHNRSRYRIECISGYALWPDAGVYGFRAPLRGPGMTGERFGKKR
jgi:hypothetical protein